MLLLRQKPHAIGPQSSRVLLRIATNVSRHLKIMTCQTGESGRTGVAITPMNGATGTSNGSKEEIRKTAVILNTGRLDGILLTLVSTTKLAKE